jgi:hypothetical protein
MYEENTVRPHYFGLIWNESLSNLMEARIIGVLLKISFGGIIDWFPRVFVQAIELYFETSIACDKINLFAIKRIIVKFLHKNILDGGNLIMKIAMLKNSIYRKFRITEDTTSEVSLYFDLRDRK